MRIARFSDGTNPVYGALEEGSKRIVGLKGDPLFSPVEPSGQIYELDEVRLLSPVIPRSKVVGIGNNYSDTPIPLDERPEPPIFLKANTSTRLRSPRGRTTWSLRASSPSSSSPWPRT